MASAVTFNTQITFSQLAQLTRQLSPAEKRRLAKLLEKEANQTETAVSPDSKSSPLETQLSASQLKTWANIKQGFDELQQIREGKQQTQSADDFLNDLKEEGYL